MRAQRDRSAGVPACRIAGFQPATRAHERRACGRPEARDTAGWKPALQMRTARADLPLALLLNTSPK